MDPLTALSLAASIVAFVDFASKILKTSNEIRKEGDLVALSAGLRARPSINVALAEDEQALDAIALECAKIADELVKTLSKLTTNGDGRGRGWESLQVAFKTIWRKGEIEDLVKRLDQYRHELGLRLLVILNKKMDLQSSDNSERLLHLEASNQKIVEIVTFTQSLLETALPRGGDKTLQHSQQDITGNQHTTKDPGQTRRQHVLSAILALNDGTTVNLANEPSSTTDAEKSTRHQNIQRVMTFGNASGSEETNESTVSNQEFSPIAKRVLLNLHYRMIHVRRESVSESSNGTFTWALEKPVSDQPWDSLPHWLESNQGCYWITGKPGSGKSTLMKYISSDERTLNYLRAWAGSYPLACASFFFWAHGTSLQKTQEGLIRGLLRDLLDQCPYLIPEVFPDLCMEMIKAKPQTLDEITPEELYIAFKRFVDKARQRVKVCLFIDGLDEYLGDHMDLCRFLFEIMESSESLKILFSSRPWNVFRDTFSRQPSLQLQDLTLSDIRLFATQELEESPGARSIENIRSGTLDMLIKSLCEKASGVFLWVALAVRSLRHGLMNGDSVETLIERLYQLPHDLERMYEHMFASLDIAQKSSAARMILMLLRGETIQTDDPVSLLQLALTEEVNLKQAIDAPVKVMPPLQRQSRCELMKRRLQGTTQGLLEVVGKEDLFFGSSSSMDSYVAFFHRTAADFFETPDMWSLLNSLVGTAFDPDLPLLAACLYEMKTLPFQRALIIASDRLMLHARQIFAYTSFLEMKHRRPNTVVLDELKRVVDRHWKEATDYKQRNFDLNWCSTEGAHWATLLMSTDRSQRERERHSPSEVEETYLFLSLSIHFGCVLYVHDKEVANSNLSKQDQADLLGQLILGHFFGPPSKIVSQGAGDLSYNYVSAISGILELGVDPNMEYNDVETRSSLWMIFLKHLWLDHMDWEDNTDNTMVRTVLFVNEQLSIYRSFILAGAHVDVVLGRQGNTYSPLSVLKGFEKFVNGCNGTLQERNEFNSKYAAIWELMPQNQLPKDAKETQEVSRRSFMSGMKKFKNRVRLSIQGPSKSK
ncbi:hypothetical protein NM208_g548 [Fusarium decemcellulare]|uniref:Uncharacterized protein n=1 Tax=Fusarium decemcellulare TaxID=57161 RepID=A0ACC1SYZ4_9HYPO|nr:hypothetical protein NM208_g548 [Fusarium decemcellulare]